jgi:hypothetical protein
VPSGTCVPCRLQRHSFSWFLARNQIPAGPVLCRPENAVGREQDSLDFGPKSSFAKMCQTKAAKSHATPLILEKNGGGGRVPGSVALRSMEPARRTIASWHDEHSRRPGVANNEHSSHFIRLFHPGLVTLRFGSGQFHEVRAASKDTVLAAR